MKGKQQPCDSEHAKWIEKPLREKKLAGPSTD